MLADFESKDLNEPQDDADLEDGRETNYYYSMFKTLEFSCCFYNLIGIGAAVINYDLEFNETNRTV